jgi:hypothetical protein
MKITFNFATIQIRHKDMNNIYNDKCQEGNNGEPQAKRISSEHVEFNTEIMFKVADKMKLPLNAIAEKMQQANCFILLDKFFRQRKSTAPKVFVSEIVSRISAL